MPRSPDGGVIADYRGPIGDPGELAARLACTPGVVEHGLFPPALVSRVLVARGADVESRVVGGAPAMMEPGANDAETR